MRIISYSEARNGLKSVLDGVEDDADITIITRRDGGDAVVMSMAHYQSMAETLYLLSSPANAAHLAASIAERPATAHGSLHTQDQALSYKLPVHAYPDLSTMLLRSFFHCSVIRLPVFLTAAGERQANGLLLICKKQPVHRIWIGMNS